MTINEIEVTGKKFRQLIDEATKLWQKISFWTKSSDVEFDDGKNAETKVGAIDGITDSLVSTSSNIAASAKAVSTINNNLGGFTPIIDDTGKITGYKTSVGGADTVFPFSSGIPQIYIKENIVSKNGQGSSSFSFNSIKHISKITGNWYSHAYNNLTNTFSVSTNLGTLWSGSYNAGKDSSGNSKTGSGSGSFSITLDPDITYEYITFTVNNRGDDRFVSRLYDIMIS